MRKAIIFGAIVFLFTTTLCGQTIIKGTLKSLLTSGYEIIANQSALNNNDKVLLQQGKTNDKGEFIANFNISSEQPVMLQFDRFFLKLWIIPNTSLTIGETAKDAYTFSGEAGIQNKFLLQSGIMMPYKMPASIYTETFQPKRQVTYLDSIEMARSLLLNQMFTGLKVDDEFKSYCMAEIVHSTLVGKSQYPLGFIYIKKTLKREDIPIDYYNFWSKFRIEEDSCQSNSYQSSVGSYTEYLATVQMNGNISDAEQLNKLIFKISDSLLINRPFTLQKQKTELLLFVMKHFDLPLLVDNELKKYRLDFPASTSLKLLSNEWDKKNKNRLTTPSFRLKDNNGKFVDIKDLRGKVVYIDFWGSWCKACLAQMPNLAIVQNKFGNKDVVFLSIDFYDTKEKWLKTIKEKKISGLHVKAEQKDEEYFDNIFGVKDGFPRYALIDKNGTLITTSAPPPSNDKLIAFIEKYLK